MANRFLSFSSFAAFTLMRRFGCMSELIFRAGVMLGSSDNSGNSIFDSSMRRRQKKGEGGRNERELGGERRGMEEESGRFWRRNNVGCYKIAGSAFILVGLGGGERCFAYPDPRKSPLRLSPVCGGKRTAGR